MTTETPEKRIFLTDTLLERTLFSSNRKDSSVFSLRYQFFRQVAGGWQDSVNQQVAKIICEKMQNENCVESHYELKHSYFINKFDAFYQKALQSYTDAQFKNLWQFVLSVELDQSADQYASLLVNSSMFLGNDSEINKAEFYHFSKGNGDRMELNDFIKAESAFVKLADSLFRVQHGIGFESDYKDLGFWFEKNQFQLSQQFYFKQDSICFIYDPFEMVPPTYGRLLLHIPFTLTKPYFKIDLSKK